jgi:hypothetical protein
MGTFLQQELGVAMSGVKWDIGNYKLWQSTEPDIILFTAKQPQLAKGQNGRYQMAVSQFRQQEDDTYKITGGSAVFTITSALQHDAQGFEALKEQWRAEMAGIGPRPPSNPRFIPLNTQKGTAQVLINPMSGTPDQAHNDVNIGTPGGTNSFLVELTSLGAQEWTQGIREQTAVPAGVKMMYEYLRLLPTVGAEVKVHAERMWTHFSASLGTSGGFLFGSSAQIDAAWEQMKREGDIEVRFIGTGLAPELEEIRQELVNTFIDQVQQRVFDALFAPAPEVDDASSGGGGGGLFGGTKFAAKFKRVEEIIDIEQTVSFEGWTWLQASMDADMTTLFSELDETYVTEVNTEMSFPATVVVDADPQLETTAISWTASEGKSPETPVFASDGGVARYTVTSAHPNDVEINWRAQVNYAPSSWPVVETQGTATVGNGGNQVVIKPASWIGRHMIYLFVRDEAGNVVFDPASPLLANSRLVANVSYEGAHLARPITESAQISPFEPLEFSYPLSPEGAAGTAKFSAFGAIGGRMVRATEQEINFDEEGVFIVASPTSIQLVSQDAVFPESDKFLSDLRRHGARPRVQDHASGPASESSPRPSYAEGSSSGNAKGEGRIEGVVIAVEYTPSGPALLIDTGHGHERVPLRSRDLADTFDDTRKRVIVDLDRQNYADRIRVQL